MFDGSSGSGSDSTYCILDSSFFSMVASFAIVTPSSPPNVNRVTSLPYGKVEYTNW